MPNSMTAFGRSRGTSQDGSKIITVEIKSVNSRYMDATVNLPRMYVYLEEKVTQMLLGVLLITESGTTDPRGKFLYHK